MSDIGQYEIISTVYNNENEIKSFLDHIAAQTLRPVRVIIVDGGSVDNTQRLVSSIEKSYPFKIDLLSSEARKNIAEGFNTGVKASATELLILTTIGNRLSSSLCYNLVHAATSDPNIEVCYPSIIGETSTRLSVLFNRYFLNDHQLVKMGASNRGVLIRRHVFDQIGFFKENFFYAGEDTEYFKRCFCQGVRMKHNDHSFVIWDVPRDLSELHQKLKVNAIADLQLFSNQWLMKHHFIFSLISLAAFIMLFVFPLEVLTLVMIILSLISIKKGIDIASMFFGVYCKIITVFYLLRNRKYRRKKYVVDRLS